MTGIAGSHRNPSSSVLAASVLLAVATVTSRAQNPQRLTDLMPGSLSSAPEQLTASAGRLFFVAKKDARPSLCVSDGTPAGTNCLANLCSGSCVRPKLIAADEGVALFWHWTDLEGIRMYAKLSYIPPGSTSMSMLWQVEECKPPNYDGPWPDMAYSAGRLYFHFADYCGAEYGLQMIDLSAGSTELLSDGYVRNLYSRNGNAWFESTISWPWTLWASAGTSSSTLQLPPVELTTGYAAWDGSVYFAAQSSDPGLSPRSEMWRTDGTPDGTFQVTRINTSQDGNADPQLLAAGGNALFFSANDGAAAHGVELWKIDPENPAGVMVSSAGGEGFYFQWLKVVNERLFFSTLESDGDVELWRSDGTAAGTVRVTDINPGANPAWPEFLTALPGGWIAFRAYDATHGRELWISDGTTANTQLVADINPGSVSSDPGELVVVGNQLFFAADDGVHGRELWVYTPPCRAPALAVRIVKQFTLNNNGHPLFSFQDPNSAGVSGYFVYRAPLPGGPWSVLGAGGPDEFPALAGLQWEDGSGDPGSYFYDIVPYFSACDMLGPR